MEKFEQDRNMVESGLTKIESIPAELSLNQAGFSSVSGENLPNNDQSILFLQTTALTDENQNIQQLEKTLDIEEVDMENQTTKRTEVNITETENFIVEQQQQTIVSANNRVYSERLRLVTSSVIWNLFSWGQSNESSIEAIEEKMFKAIRVKIERFYVHIRNNSLKMWTVSANTESANIPIVLVHGFCGGVGLWLHNIDALSENRPFYAFDLLGFGRSSRPNFSTDPIVAENQFIESIEDWRKALNLNEIILMGHSFGGYLSASYALKYPQHIKALILADPWGFPEMPMVKPDTPMPLWASFALKCFRYVSPLSLFRMSGQIGVSLFKHLRPDFKRKYMTVLEEPEIVYNYLYHANAFHPSGEAGFKAISEFFGYAKNPMIRRISKVRNDIPIWFIYGSRSWIEPTAGFATMKLREDSIFTSVKIITGAGHHAYADKPSEFNEYVKYILGMIDEHLKSNQDYPNTQISDFSSDSLLAT